MFVTTTPKPNDALIDKAIEWAGKIQAQYIPRKQNTLAQLRRMRGDEETLVVQEEAVKLLLPNDQTLFFHPSMALIRIKRLRSGGSDRLIELAGVRPGDRVLDCTAGLGSDAAVFAYAAGREGEVAAIESSPLLYHLVEEGLKTYSTGIEDIDAAFRQVRMLFGHHLDLLTNMPDRSFDVVYFDPMFRNPIEASQSISPLRTYAKSDPLSKESIRQAVRVARRIVILKEHRDSEEFARLGFTLPAEASTKLAYGVIPIEA